MLLSPRYGLLSPRFVLAVLMASGLIQETTALELAPVELKGVDGELASLRLRRFVGDHAIRVLNVAGPRASGEPGVAQFVRTTLDAALGTP